MSKEELEAENARLQSLNAELLAALRMIEAQWLRIPVLNQETRRIFHADLKALIAKTRKNTCLACHGTGKVEAPDSEYGFPPWMDCPQCKQAITKAEQP
jgi:hypothetical protein